MSSGEYKESISHTNRLHRFLERHRSSYETIRIPLTRELPTNITLFIPKSELEGKEKDGNRVWYPDAVLSAIEKNRRIFGVVPPQLNYLFVETTEEYNDYYYADKWGQKAKGDRIKGSANFPDVICFTPQSLPNETNFEAARAINEAPSHYVRSVLDHESAHNWIAYKYGKGTILPAWVGEGIPMTINHSPIESPFSQEYQQRLKDFLQRFPDVPPTNRALREAQSTSTPFFYNYGQEFLTWLILRFGPENVPELELKSELDRLLYNGIERGIFDPEKAIQKTYFISYKNAYKEFCRYLLSP